MNTRPATAILAEIREGRLVIELSDAIREACAAVTEHGKPASVTLDLTIRPFKDGQRLVEQPLIFMGEVSSKLPKAQLESTLFFIGVDGNATRQPGERQPGLSLSVAARKPE